MRVPALPKKKRGAGFCACRPVSTPELVRLGCLPAEVVAVAWLVSTRVSLTSFECARMCNRDEVFNGLRAGCCIASLYERRRQNQCRFTVDKRCAGSLISVDRLVITRPLSASPSTEISEKISAHFLALQKGSLPASRGHRRVPVASSGNYFLWVRATLCFAP